MKYLKYTAAVVLLLATNTASYLTGYHNNDSKNYEAACLQADFIHSLMDDEDWGSETEELYYEWFQDLDMGIYKTNHLHSIKELNAYSWCY